MKKRDKLEEWYLDILKAEREFQMTEVEKSVNDAESQKKLPQSSVYWA